MSGETLATDFLRPHLGTSCATRPTTVQLAGDCARRARVREFVANPCRETARRRSDVVAGSGRRSLSVDPDHVVCRSEDGFCCRNSGGRKVVVRSRSVRVLSRRAFGASKACYHVWRLNDVHTQTQNYSGRWLGRREAPHQTDSHRWVSLCGWTGGLRDQEEGSDTGRSARRARRYSSSWYSQRCA